MRDEDSQRDRGYEPGDPEGVPAPEFGTGELETDVGNDPLDESLTDELSALIDDGRTYVEAEIAFQKTRAGIAGKSVGFAGAYLLVALITLHIAILALAVGLVIALEPLITIWGAISVVVGVLLLLTIWLALKAKKHASRLGKLFGSGDGSGNA